MGSSSTRYSHRKGGRDGDRHGERARQRHVLSDRGWNEAGDVPCEENLRCQRRVDGLVMVDGELLGDCVGVRDCDRLVVLALL